MMRRTPPSVRSNRRAWRGTIAAIVLAGCSDPNVVASAGRTRLTVADWHLFESGRSPVARHNPTEELNHLVDRALLAEEAKREHLLDDPAFKARVEAAERELLASAIVEKHLAAATTDKLVRQRYEERKNKLALRRVHVRQILIRVLPGTPDTGVKAAQSRALVAMGRAQKGEDFATLARDLSDDPAARTSGGELPVLTEGRGDPEFFAAAVQLKRGEVSQPVRTAIGFHVIKAIDDPSLYTPTFQELRGQLTAELRSEAEAALVKQVRDDIGAKLYVERLPKEAGK